MQVPANDPLILVSALASVTSDIGLAITSSVAQSHPFQFARQISTLDHLSGGRAGWNIVTSRLENSHRNFGAPGLVPHDDRYDWADEYVDVAYKLWEGSWDEGALIQDKEGYRHADPARVHKIYHEGERYRVDGPHLVSPSPQRVPLLFQAGASDRGRRFGAANAEAVFMNASGLAEIAEFTTDVRNRAEALGRRRDDIAFFQGLQIVVGGTEEEARRKAAEIDEYSDIRARLAHMGGGLGVDLGGLPLDTPLGEFDSDGNRGMPEQIADDLIRRQDAGLDGFNVVNALLPQSYVDIVDGLFPLLRERGLVQSEYTPGTLREKLFGTSPHLNERHPATRYRGALEQYSAAAENVPPGPVDLLVESDSSLSR